jgi:putative DNA primase/helicase
VTFEHVRRLHALGLSVIPLESGSKDPALDSWKPYQTERPTDADIRKWFGNGARHNVGIVLGRVSSVVVIESDSPAAEAWCAAHLPQTPMMTRSARGLHRYYRRPLGVPDIPAHITTADGVKIEIKRDGQYVVGPGSVHPGNPALGIPPGHIYAEVEPWPASLGALPVLPMDLVEGQSASAPAPLPRAINDGSRNDTLFREGCRLRRLGWDESEIAASLAILNRARCTPPLADVELRAIAQSCGRYAPAADTFPATEAGDAEFFAACNADTVRYDHRRGQWLLFAGNVWVPQTDGEVARLALDAIRARQSAAVGNTDRLKWALGGEARRRQSNLLALARNLKPIADAGDQWDLDPWLLGAPNGVIDLRTGTLRPGQPDDRITMRVAAPFDRNAVCPLYDATVAAIFNDEERDLIATADLIAYFDRYVGYSLTGDCSEEALAFCWGDGANGKGTLMNTIGWLLGDYADNLPFSAFELHSRAGIPNDIAKIVGKRYITASETGETARLNEARVKALTGRDPITARFLHKEFFTFQPVAKFWLAANSKPEVHDDSEGFWRRLHLIPFTASFIGREDKTLKDRLRLEASGILARAVRGCLAWQREGLSPPVIVSEATKTYRADSRPLARFLDECCVLGPDAHASFGELFGTYVKWAGHESRMGRHEFTKALRQEFKTNEADGKRNQHLPVLFLGVQPANPNATAAT